MLNQGATCDSRRERSTLEIYRDRLETRDGAFHLHEVRFGFGERQDLLIYRDFYDRTIEVAGNDPRVRLDWAPVCDASLVTMARGFK
jgi:hypothetical protein